ncbi:MAG: hypothetical protein [Caudoviricetes sp.]|nr:MAG: hypothetical protein [Caudoviricetes sp.]
MFNELKKLLEDFNPTLTQINGQYNLCSDILVLSQTLYKGEIILFGYIENLDGSHGWIKVLDTEFGMREIIDTAQSQVALRKP